MYYICREDGMMVRHVGSGKIMAFMPETGGAVALFSLQGAIMQVEHLKMQTKDKTQRMFIVKEGEKSPMEAVLDALEENQSKALKLAKERYAETGNAL